MQSISLVSQNREKCWSVDSSAVYKDFIFSRFRCQRQNQAKRQISVTSVLSRSMLEVYSKENQELMVNGEDTVRRCRGKRSMSGYGKVNTELAYLCKLKLSPRTMGRWFQLKCSVHVGKISGVTEERLVWSYCFTNYSLLWLQPLMSCRYRLKLLILTMCCTVFCQMTSLLLRSSGICTWRQHVYDIP